MTVGRLDYGVVCDEKVLICPTQAVCHCIPCRKISGTNGGVYTIIKHDQVYPHHPLFLQPRHRPNINYVPQYTRLSGPVKNYTRTWSDSGNPVEYTCCDNCGTAMFVEATTGPELKFVRTGTLDEPESLLKAVPSMEIYTKHRPDWCIALDGTVQHAAAVSH